MELYDPIEHHPNDRFFVSGLFFWGVKNLHPSNSLLRFHPGAGLSRTASRNCRSTWRSVNAVRRWQCNEKGGEKNRNIDVLICESLRVVPFYMYEVRITEKVLHLKRERNWTYPFILDVAIVIWKEHHSGFTHFFKELLLILIPTPRCPHFETKIIFFRSWIAMRPPSFYKRQKVGMASKSH